MINKNMEDIEKIRNIVGMSFSTLKKVIINYNQEKYPPSIVPKVIGKNEVFDNFEIYSAFRYSLIVSIGLHHYLSSVGTNNHDEIRNKVNSFLDDSGTYFRNTAMRLLNLGDLGLFFVSCMKYDKTIDKEVIEKISRLNNKAIEQLDGMGISWLIWGLIEYADKNPMVQKVLDELVHFHLSYNYNKNSSLFYHRGKSLRRRFPNFATQIYSIFAISKYLSHFRGVDTYEDHLNKVISVAEKICELQLKDGGWAWMYDADRGCIVEPFEIYSVHQDSMAPMALLELAKITKKGRYNKNIENSLAWIYGQNMANYNMVDEKRGIVYRSIRRKKPYAKTFLYNNILTSHIKKPNYQFNFFEVNDSCRPYHLGWILYCWSANLQVMH